MRIFKREPKEVEAEAKAVAKAMGEGWRHVHDKDNCWCFALVNTEGHQIHVSLNNAPKKYHASVSWPFFDGNRHKPREVENDSLNCNFQRGPDALAREIKRRLFPVLDEFWNQAIQSIEEWKVRKSGQEKTIEELCELCGTRPGVSSPYKIYGGNFGIRNLTVNNDGTKAQLETWDIPIDLVKKIIEMVREANIED